MEKKRFSLTDWWNIYKELFTKFIYDNGLNHAGSIAFFTIFSLPGVLLGVMWITGSLLGEQHIQEQLFTRISAVLGAGSAEQVLQVLDNLKNIEYSWLTAVIAICSLVYGATSVFATIEDGINVIWGLRLRPRRVALKFFLNRLLSLSMILIIGFLMLVSLIADGLIGVFSEAVDSWIGADLSTAFDVSRFLFFFVLVWFIFTGIYKVLPDGRVTWRQLLPGAFITTIFFFLGKYAIEIYLEHTSWGTAYGTAGSLVLILLWIYYSSIILLMGAEYIEITNRKKGRIIKPSDDSRKIIMKEVEFD